MMKIRWIIERSFVYCLRRNFKNVQILNNEMVKNLLDSKNYDDREKRKKGKIKNVTGISVSIYPSINRMQRLTRETLARFAQRI